MWPNLANVRVCVCLIWSSSGCCCCWFVFFVIYLHRMVSVMCTLYIPGVSTRETRRWIIHIDREVLVQIHTENPNHAIYASIEHNKIHFMIVSDWWKKKEEEKKEILKQNWLGWHLYTMDTLSETEQIKFYRQKRAHARARAHTHSLASRRFARLKWNQNVSMETS